VLPRKIPRNWPLATWATGPLSGACDDEQDADGGSMKSGKISVATPRTQGFFRGFCSELVYGDAVIVSPLFDQSFAASG
jgi:hypothetical protein